MGQRAERNQRTVMNTLAPEGGATAQGIGGARSGHGAGPPQVAMRRDGTPAKPGFRRSRKCAQMKSLLYPIFYLLFLVFYPCL
jgi:hypothetical protein